jgi:hypothetical protein
MKLFFHKVFVIFNRLLPTLIKTMYTIVAKFPASTSEHVTCLSTQLSCQTQEHSFLVASLFKESYFFCLVVKAAVAGAAQFWVSNIAARRIDSRVYSEVT